MLPHEDHMPTLSLTSKVICLEVKGVLLGLIILLGFANGVACPLQNTPKEPIEISWSSVVANNQESTIGSLVNGEGAIDKNHVLIILPKDGAKLTAEQKLTYIAINRNTQTNEETAVIVKWESNNKQVITISNNGRAEAVGLGVAQIIATYGSTKAILNVEVLKPSDKASSGSLPPVPDSERVNKPTPARLLDDEITKLLNNLNSDPTQDDIDKAADLISRASALGHEADLEKALRHLLEDDKTAILVLIALSRFTLREFDTDLADFLSKIPANSLGVDKGLLLNAVARSGGQACIERLQELGRTPFQAPTTGPSTEQLAFRRQVWNTYFNLAPALSTSDAVNFYNTPAGRFELEQDSKTADMLIDFINRVA
ncbi:MAG TPA: hypothetical protein VE732_00435, partial [Nitrososphaera sp.]|nr:hypothetical protein [Nitrososphaera sp.]